MPKKENVIEYSPASVSSKNRKYIVIIATIIFLATFLVYFNTLKNDFIWDDEYLILHNSHIKSFSHFFDAFKLYIGYGSENINNFYRPLQEISNMLDYFLWGTDPTGFHLTNVLLHSFAAVFVFFLLFYLCDNIAIAGIAGLFYGIHPIHTEAIAYIAGRADPLYAVFFFLSFIFFIRHINHLLKGRKDACLLPASAIFFVLALLSKEISLVLPFLMILYIYVLLKDNISKPAFQKVKNLWVGHGVIVLIYVFLRSTVLNFSSIAPPLKLKAIPLVNRLFTFFEVLMVYFKLLIFPTDLHMERTIRVVRSVFEPGAIVSFLVVLGLLWYAIVLYRRRSNPISFFIAWFFVSLLPVSNIYPINSFLAEHWLYIASVGYFYVIAMFVLRLYERSKNNFAFRITIIVSMVVLFGVYSVMTVRRNRDWKNETTFFENTLRYSPKNARLYLNLGNTYYEQHNLAKAIEQYEKAISVRKNYPAAYGNLGSIYIAKGDLVEGKKYLKKAIELKFNFPISHYNLGLVYYKTGEKEKAIEELNIALKQLPQHYPSLNLLGKIYLGKGDRQKAYEYFQRSLKIMPNQKKIRKLIERVK